MYAICVNVVVKRISSQSALRIRFTYTSFFVYMFLFFSVRFMYVVYVCVSHSFVFSVLFLYV